MEEERDDFVKLHLHLDHREHGWGQRLHDTEYDSDIVKTEASRLQRWMVHFTKQDKSGEEQEEKGFLSKLFS